MKSIVLVVLIMSFIFFGCENNEPMVIGTGEMPDAVTFNNELHVVYGNGDSILYTRIDANNELHHEVVGVVPDLAASHMRGPQLAKTTHGLTVIACNEQGDIFSYTKAVPGKWKIGGKVNDQDTVAKEGLLSLAGEGELLYAVWLDLRSKHNQLYGARSSNGGLSWGRNNLIYASPDTTVCECCKPTVAMENNNVIVQFRNWLNGNRDMYLIRSYDAGTTFNQAEKLGEGNWQLDGCPMDGGDVLFSKNTIQTVWRRKGMMYVCEPGKKEVELAEGKNPVMTAVNGEPVFAWSENGIIKLRMPRKETITIGKGSNTVLVSNNKEVVCIYEEGKQILKVVKK